MINLKLTKKTRHLALAISAIATVVCLSTGLINRNHSTGNNHSRYQIEILLFCAGLSSAITFELLGQSLSNSSLRKPIKPNRSPLSKISSPKSQLLSPNNSAQKPQRFLPLFFIVGIVLFIPLFADDLQFGYANSVSDPNTEPMEAILKGPENATESTHPNGPEALNANELRQQIGKDDILIQLDKSVLPIPYNSDTQDIIELYLQDARTAVKVEDHQTALELYTKVLSLDNQNIEALTQKCSILSQTEGPNAARLSCEHLAFTGRNSPVILSTLGKIYQNMEQYQAALSYYEQALHLNPDYHPAQQGKNEVRQFISQPQQGSSSEE